MKNIILLSMVMWGVFVASPDVARATATCDKTPLCSNALITKMILSSDGNVYFSVDGDMTLMQPQCTLYSSSLAILPPSLPSFKMIYATMLAAKLTQTPLMFRMNTSGTCTVMYVTM